MNLDNAILSSLRLLSVAALSLGGAAIANTMLNRLRKSQVNYKSYRVSFLGPPGVGKSTAVVSLLDWIANSALSGRVRIRGANTIERLERGVVALATGGFPSRTSEEDSEISRFDYSPIVSPITRIICSLFLTSQAFRVEIADFAGEHTELFSGIAEAGGAMSVPDSFGDSAGQNFLKWVSESDCCALFVDMKGWSKEGPVFVEAITAKYRAFWQNYLDLHSEKLGPKSGTPVVIVFSKMDMIWDNEDTEDIPIGLQKVLLEEFRKMLGFMGMNSRKVSVVFMSAVRRNSLGERIGAAELARAILPVPTFE